MRNLLALISGILVLVHIGFHFVGEYDVIYSWLLVADFSVTWLVSYAVLAHDVRKIVYFLEQLSSSYGIRDTSTLHNSPDNMILPTIIGCTACIIALGSVSFVFLLWNINFNDKLVAVHIDQKLYKFLESQLIMLCSIFVFSNATSKLVVHKTRITYQNFYTEISSGLMRRDL